MLLASMLLYPEYFKVVLKMVYQAQGGMDNTYFGLMDHPVIIAGSVSLCIALIYNIVYLQSEKIFKSIFVTIACIILYCMEHKAWYYHMYPALCMMFLVMIAVLVAACKNPAQTTIEHCLKNFCLLAFGFTLLLWALLLIQQYHLHWVRYAKPQSQLNQLLKFESAQNHRDVKVFILNTRVTPTYEMAMYGNFQVVSPWSNLWMLPALLNFKAQTQTYYLSKKLLLRMTLDTLKNHQPKFIIYPKVGSMAYIDAKNVNVIHYLQQDSNIQKQLQGYRWYKTVGNFDILVKKISLKLWQIKSPALD